MSETHYPFMFNFRAVVSGNGFLASVDVLGGRGLMLQEENEWWMYGVRPAGLAETGESSQATFLLFMERIKAVLFDIAAETNSFEEFYSATRKFLTEKISVEEERWNAAQQKLRAGTVTPEAPFLSSLPKESPDNRPTDISVTRVDGIRTEAPFSSKENMVYATTPLLAA